MALQLVSVEDLERRAWGLIQYMRAVMPSADVDILLEEALNDGRETLAEDLETVWERTSIVASRSAVDGELQEVAYDYHPGMFRAGNLPRWVLRRRPVFSVDKVHFSFGHNFGVLTAPSEWYRIDTKLGVLSLVPIGHTAAIASTAGAWFLPWFENMQPAADIPQFVAVDYTAGWYDPEGTAFPPNTQRVKDAICAQATLYLLQTAAPRLVPVSATTPDASQSFMDIGQETDRLEKSIEAFKSWWSRHYRPPRIVVI